jgi:hypothetical protein
LESPALWPYRRTISICAALAVIVCAGFAFRQLRAAHALTPAPLPSSSASDFLRERGPRIFWFFVSLLIVSLVAWRWGDAHSLVGRLSALPLVPLFVLHWAVTERRIDLGELRIAAVIGPVAVGAFLIVFTLSLGLIRSDAGELHPLYWPIGLALLLAEWELTRRLILAMSRWSYRE